ncbi:MAG TPA: Spo0B domain-containing protein [Verrucomicrobiae bacterium]|nr:Spo0B domain-containing protein [Verrucomicrobiae bacterium]
MENWQEKNLAQLLHLYRVQRHDFLNHFQVAMGYMQLGKTERALEYLKQAAAEAQATAPLARVKPGELAVGLLDFQHACFMGGIDFVSNCPEDLAEIKWTTSHAKAMDLVRGLVTMAKGVEIILNQATGNSIGIEFVLLGLTKADLGNCISDIGNLNIPFTLAELEQGICLKFKF